MNKLFSLLLLAIPLLTVTGCNLTYAYNENIWYEISCPDDIATASKVPTACYEGTQQWFIIYDAVPFGASAESTYRIDFFSTKSGSFMLIQSMCGVKGYLKIGDELGTLSTCDGTPRLVQDDMLLAMLWINGAPPEQIQEIITYKPYN